MKWENRDINVLEQTNIPQFSRLDDIGTPLRLFESFFVNMLVHMIVRYTKFMVIERKQILVLKTSHETFRLFFGMLFLSGSHKLPDRKIY